MELTRNMEGKEILKVEEVADILKVDIEAVKDFIICGDLPAIGRMKRMVKRIDLYRFINGDMLAVENIERPIDSSGNQRYSNSHSIEVKDLSDEEWDKMSKSGKRELNEYYNEERGKWYLALSLGYDENHKRKRKVITADTKEELWMKHLEFKSQNKVLPADENIAIIPPAVMEKPKHPKEDMLFKDYLIQYLESIKGKTTSRTYDTKVNSSKHIIKGLGDYKICEIDTIKLRGFVYGLTEKTYEIGGQHKRLSQSSINKIYDLLNKVIKEASSEEGDKILQKDFMRSVEKPRSRAHNDKEPRGLSNEEFKKVSDIVKSNIMMDTWVHIMMYTGARPSEALALKFSDINYEKKTIKIRRALSYDQDHDVSYQKRLGTAKAFITDLKNERPKNNKVNYQKRELEVSQYILDIIKRWESYVKGNTKLMEMKRANGTEEFLFCGSRGQFWLYRDYRQVYGRLLEKEGLDIGEFNPYRFRHSFCTECLRQKIDIKTVQLMMGDNTPDMVLRVYANMDKEDVFRGSRIFAKLMDEILEYAG